MLDVLHVMAVRLLRILGLCTPWRRPLALRGDVDRVRMIVYQVRDRRHSRLHISPRPPQSVCFVRAWCRIVAAASTLIVTPAPLNLCSLQS